MQIKTIQSILYNKLQLLPLFGNKKFQTTNFIAPTKFELRSRLKLEFKSSRFFFVRHIQETVSVIVIKSIKFGR